MALMLYFRHYLEASVTELKHLSLNELAAQLQVEIGELVKPNTPNKRAIRRRYTTRLEGADPNVVIDLARALLELDPEGLRWVAYELIQFHPGAFGRLDRALLEELGAGINSWWTTDSFGRSLSGPAWLAGLIEDVTVHDWARSEDFWWRRAALVSTVALNIRTHGGYGDTQRTLAVCELLVNDHEDMVIKGLSWALRDLVWHDPQAVWGFLAEHDACLAARVKREVCNKLETGLKNPKVGRPPR